jgi:hypothetical protein
MRWIIAEEPTMWTKRTRSGFLLLPKSIGGEFRWLERATWAEHWVEDRWAAYRWLTRPNLGKREGAA